MPKRRLAAFAGLLALLAQGCKTELPPAQAAPPIVSVSQPIEKEVLAHDVYPGRFQATESVDIRARVRGYIEKVNFEDGQIVKEGHVLFEIDPRPFQAELKAAESQVAQWQAKLTRAEADVKRYGDLLPKGAASQQDLDRSAAEAEEARAMIRAGGAAVDRANLDLEYAKVTAPIAGRIGRALITKGNLVGEESLLTTIVSVDPIFAYFNVNERELLTYKDLAQKQGRTVESVKAAKIPVELGLSTDENTFPHSGVIDFADNRSETGTTPVRAVVENRSGLLQPGFFCSVRVPMGEKARAILVPDRAILTDQDRKYALVVKSDNTVDSRTLKLGRRHGELRQVLEGVGPEDRIIVNGMQRARVGGTVDPRQDAAGAGTKANGGTKEAPAEPKDESSK
jgi:membrane fusion protein, multidrug efflux system